MSIRVFIIALTGTAMIFTACEGYNKYSKEDFLYSKKITEGIYCESYRIASYGVGGDVYSVYLTDSTRFRKLVMVYYDNDFVDFKTNGNEILVIRKEERKSPKGPSSQFVVEKKTFDLLDLKSSGGFE